MKGVIVKANQQRKLPLQHLFFCCFPNVIPLHYVHYNYMHSAHICMMHRIWTIMQIRHD